MDNRNLDLEMMIIETERIEATENMVILVTNIEEVDHNEFE